MRRIDYTDRAAASKLQLRAAANTNHDDAEEMYGCYGAHITLTNDEGEQTGPDVCVQAVESEWLRDGLRGDDLIAKIMEETIVDRKDDAESLAGLAERVWEDMSAVDDLLDRAVTAYESGDVEACIEMLQDAGRAEREHGDDPSTRNLARQLLEERRAYRVYCAPDGCDPSYCGEYSTLEAAQEAAEREPAGCPRANWDTARAAGHCGGLYAPPAEGDEDEEPESWHGASGWHYVVRVQY